MKVKVNGAWVDVPAFKVVEQSGEVVEGEVTIASDIHYIPVTHNKGKVSKFATIEHTTDTSSTWILIGGFIADFGFIFCGGGVYRRNATTLETTSAVPLNNSSASTWTAKSTEEMVQFFAGNTSYKFKAGTYRYKIYFD